MSAEILEFFRHGVLPERPLQPPEQPPAPDPRDLTFAEKLEAVRKMAKHSRYRMAVIEALGESDSYELFLSGLLMGHDTTACEVARAAIVDHVEKCAEGNDESLEDFL